MAKGKTMKVAWTVVLFLLLSACQGKLDTSETGGTEAASEDLTEQAKAEEVKTAPAISMADPAIVTGIWSSQCIAEPNSDTRPGAQVQYEFGPNNEGTFKIVSYRDAECELRYTKADADRIKARVQADAAAAGLPPPTDKELNVFDALWIPPTEKFQYKLGRQYTNRVIELDLTTQGAAEAEPTIFTSFLIDQGLLYFSRACLAVDSIAGRCTPVTGDQVDRRAKKIDFSVGYEKQ